MEYLTKTEFVDRRVGDRRASVVPKADARAATLLQLGPVATFLDAEDTIEVSVNRAGEVLVETRKGWLTHALPELDFVRLERLAIAVTSLTDQTWSPVMPLLSGALPDGCRLQIVGPPAVAPGSISLTIRKPSTAAYSADDLDRMGLFAGYTEMIKAAFFAAMVYIVMGLMAAQGYFTFLYAEFATALLLGIDPIFVCCALCDKTRSYFDDWLKQITNFIVLKVLGLAVLEFMLRTFDILFNSSSAVGLETGVIAVITTGFFCTAILYNLPAIAGSITGGVWTPMASTRRRLVVLRGYR